MLKVLRKHWLLFLSGFLILLLGILYWQKEEIAENDFVKAKMEFFEGAVNQHTAKMKEAIDSMKNYINNVNK